MFHKGLRALRVLRTPTLILVLGTAFAFGGSGDHGKRSEKRLDHRVATMEKELKLSKDQSAKIRAILAKDSATMPIGRGAHPGPGAGPGHHGAMGAGPLEGPFGEFSKQLRNNTVDTEALNRQFEERLADMRLMHARHVVTFTEIHAVLTPEQRAKAADLIDKRLEKRKKK